MRVGLIALAMSSLCACAPNIDARTLHEVDGEVVSSPPVGPAGYEAYLRARLALERESPDYALALEYLEVALSYDSGDARLWTTKAEAEAATGDPDAARESLARALELSPDYDPALQLRARLADGSGAM